MLELDKDFLLELMSELNKVAEKKSSKSNNERNCENELCNNITIRSSAAKKTVDRISSLDGYSKRSEKEFLTRGFPFCDTFYFDFDYKLTVEALDVYSTGVFAEIEFDYSIHKYIIGVDEFEPIKNERVKTLLRVPVSFVESTEDILYNILEHFKTSIMYSSDKNFYNTPYNFIKEYKNEKR